MTNTDEDIADLLRAEAEHAEAHRDDPVPDDYPSTRPNLRRGATFTLRLPQRELDELQALAEESDLPASALVRSWIAQHLRAARDAPADARELLWHIESDIRQLRKLVP